ncbi:hypothetical protein PINS_up010066 [Pythium insidiosum]|nr:hypothetical protein PINS_up010066 [Pythium insidiosum]
MKRRLPPSTRPSALLHEPAAFPATDVTVERRGDQIVPLREDPALQSLTPRSLARSVAELDALRSRVQELEQKLSQHDVALLPTDLSRSSKRLPPLSELRDISSSSSSSSAAPNSLEVTADLATATLERKSVQATATLSVSPPSPPLSVSSLESHDDQHQHQQQSSPSSFPIDTRADAARIVYASATSPHREQAKILLEPEGDAVFAVSRRNRLYQILKRVSTVVPITEDQLLRLKKLVDAEIGDVITFLLSVEHETDASSLATQLTALLETGSPSKHRLASIPWGGPVVDAADPVLGTRAPHDWTIQYPLQKVAHNLEQLRVHETTTADSKTDVIVLVSSGAYNPIHMLHIRAFYVARQYVESNYKFPVVGAFVSPSHDTYVRVKNRRKPHEMIPKRHRLGLIEAAVASSSWIEVDKWEITRRRVLDYLQHAHARARHVRDALPGVPLPRHVRLRLQHGRQAEPHGAARRGLWLHHGLPPDADGHGAQAPRAHAGQDHDGRRGHGRVARGARARVELPRAPSHDGGQPRAAAAGARDDGRETRTAVPAAAPHPGQSGGRGAVDRGGQGVAGCRCRVRRVHGAVVE